MKIILMLVALVQIRMIFTIIVMKVNNENGFIVFLMRITLIIIIDHFELLHKSLKDATPKNRQSSLTLLAELLHKSYAPQTQTRRQIEVTITTLLSSSAPNRKWEKKTLHKKADGQKWPECKRLGADTAIPSDIGKVFLSYVNDATYFSGKIHNKKNWKFNWLNALLKGKRRNKLILNISA